jgi:hypothetical protein
MFTYIKVLEGGLLNRLDSRGHTFGTCMTNTHQNLMYVNIPKNASSWTKPNLKDLKWEDFNYHYNNLYKKHALVVLRDPVERWLSGICEYFTLYHANIDAGLFNSVFYDLLLDQITLDDHTEKQFYFIDGLNTERITFFMCDENYRLNFSKFLIEHGYENRYHRYDYQHTTSSCPIRSKFKKIFEPLVSEPKYLERIKEHYKQDYELIESVQFYAR